MPRLVRRADKLLGTAAVIFQVTPEHPEMETQGSSHHRATGPDAIRGWAAAQWGWGSSSPCRSGWGRARLLPNSCWFQGSAKPNSPETALS